MGPWLSIWVGRVREDRGQAYIEYVVLGAVAVLVILGAIQFFFGSVAALFERLGRAISEF